MLRRIGSIKYGVGYGIPVVFTRQTSPIPLAHAELIMSVKQARRVALVPKQGFASEYPLSIHQKFKKWAVTHYKLPGVPRQDNHC